MVWSYCQYSYPSLAHVVRYDFNLLCIFGPCSCSFFGKSLVLNIEALFVEFYFSELSLFICCMLIMNVCKYVKCLYMIVNVCQ